MSKQRSALLVTALLALTATGLAKADAMMRCGGSLIETGGDPPTLELEVRGKCGEPSSRQGNNWYYKRADGSTYRLHFNDNGELKSIHEEIR